MSVNLAPIGDLAEFINGVAFKPDDWTDEGPRIIRIQNLNDPEKPYNRTRRPVADKYHVRPGDLLVSWSASLGVYEWSDPEVALVNQHIFRVVPDADVVDKGYLRHGLSTALVSMERHLHGATMKHVNRSEFLGTEIPLPSIPEQRRIAAILDHADALRAKRREALARLDELTQSIFIDMFGDSRTIYTRWQRTALKDVLTDIESGRSPTCHARPASGEEYGVLKLGAVTYGVFDPSQNKALPEGVEPHTRYEVRAGDLLFTRKNTADLVGAAALVRETRAKLLLPDLIFRLRIDPESRMEPAYLQAAMMYPPIRRGIQVLAGGSAGSMPNISKAKLRTVDLPHPPAELQLAFARRVQSVERLKEDHRVALTELDALFASLQSRAFRGEL